ncbi:MAG: DUF4129 domain-containing protein [Bifidobacteriaceae bacterium]|nr:DUF4129 domain-containing protein [Bifidobacteriaceae bacterium]
MAKTPGPPLDPGAEEARRWLEEELSKRIYQQKPTLLERLWQWIGDLLFTDLGAGSWQLWQAIGLVLVIAGVLALVAWRVAGPLRLRSHSQTPGPVLGEERRSAEELRTEAEARARSEDWRWACVLAFQALARRLEDRAILDRQPGRTAHELAAAAASPLPALAADLSRAADQFDAIAYGHAPGDAAVYRFLSELGRRADDAKPVGLLARAASREEAR